MKIGKLQIVRNRTIQKRDYIDKSEFKFDKLTDVVPKKKSRLLCIIFGEEKSCHFILRKLNQKKELDYFRFKKGMYIIDNEAIHIASNGSRVAFYLEGISTPIKMSNIEKYMDTVEYTDILGNKKKSTVQKIKGLKFDSKILDTFANRRFAELFTKQPVKMGELLLLLLSVITLILVVVGYGVVYYFR